MSQQDQTPIRLERLTESRSLGKEDYSLLTWDLKRIG